MLMNPFTWIVTGSLFVVLIIFVIVWRSPIVIEGNYRRTGKQDEAFVKISGLFGLIHYKLSIPELRVRGLKLLLKKHATMKHPVSTNKSKSDETISVDDISHYLDQFKQFLRATADLKIWMKRSLRRFELKQLTWHTAVGTGDAMWTAISTGGFWTVKTTLIGFISHNMRLKAKPSIRVQPIYSHPTFSTEGKCIAEISFGNAIVAGLALIVRMLKEKGGVKAWQNILFKA